MWIITFVSVWLGFTWGVFRIFKEFGEAAPDKTKQELANWMLNINKMETPPLHLYFIYLFDYIYTLRHLSWKCFYRSTITSILIYSSSLASLVIFSLLLNDDLFMLSFIDSDYVEFALIYVIVFLVLNLVPDYFSLLQTRYTLKLLKNSKRIKRWVLVLVMDLVWGFSAVTEMVSSAPLSNTSLWMGLFCTSINVPDNMRWEINSWVAFCCTKEVSARWVEITEYS